MVSRETIAHRTPIRPPLSHPPLLRPPLSHLLHGCTSRLRHLKRIRDENKQQRRRISCIWGFLSTIKTRIFIIWEGLRLFFAFSFGSIIVFILIKGVADVARGHGGDGGNQDPNRNAIAISNVCECSQVKKRRGPGRNIKLHKKVERNRGEPLPLAVVEGARQYQFVGPNATDFKRLISNTIAVHVPFHYKDWQSVPDEYKNVVYPLLFDLFNLNRFREGDARQWAGIQAGITADCQSRYRCQKSQMKQHFLKHGGYDDIEAAKACCPEDYEPEKWVKLINNLFLDPGYRIHCGRNKKSRSKHKYPSYHGSQSYAQNQYMEEKKTGSSNYFDVFKRTHCKDRNWANEACKADWEKIQAELARSSRDADGSSSAIDDIGVLERALGRRRGHIRDVGCVVRTITPEISGTYPSSQQQFQEMQKEMEQMRQEVQEMRQQQQVQLFSNQALMELLHQQNQQHEFQMKQMTLEFQRQINELKAQLPHHDEDDEYEDDEDDN